MSDVVYVARCPEHGLHGCRQECFECGGPVEQVAMVPLATVPAADAGLRAAVEGLADLSAAATPGPWEVNDRGVVEAADDCRTLIGHVSMGGGAEGPSNARIIVAAVNLVRSLLAGRGDVG